MSFVKIMVHAEWGQNIDQIFLPMISEKEFVITLEQTPKRKTFSLTALMGILTTFIV